jgi:hypothetical protein
MNPLIKTLCFSASLVFGLWSINTQAITAPATLIAGGATTPVTIAGEATTPFTPALSVPTGGSTRVTGYVINSSVTVGSGFNGTAGIFQPTIAGRYLITGNAYSGVSCGWVLLINNTTNRGAVAATAPGNGCIANVSKVLYLNGSTDTTSLSIQNYTGTPASINDVNITWTKLP